MSERKPPTTDPKAGIPSGLLAASKRRTSAFVAKIRQAMATIEREVDENQGIYPYNGGRLSQAELCRRARVTNVGLATPAHRDTTRKMVQDWLARVALAGITGKKSVRRAVTARADDWERRHAALAQSYRLAELDFVEMRRRVAALQAENEALRKQLEASGASKLVPLHGKRRSEL